MKRRESLVSYVLINNFTIIITAVIIVIISLLVAFCTFYRSARISEAKSALNNASSSIQFSIEEKVRQSDFIVRNNSMTELLDTEFDDNYELVKFMNEFSVFINSIEEGDDGETNNFLLYSTNPTLINSGYVYSDETLPIFDKIVNSARVGKEHFYWDNEIGTTEEQTRYITLYRYIPMKYDCIIEMKIPVDESLPLDNTYNVNFCLADEINENNSLFFKKNIIDNFALTASIENSMLIKKYIEYFFIFLLIGVAFLIITYSLASRSVDGAMSDILELISQIESGDIISDTDEKYKSWKEVRVIKDKISFLTRKLNEISKREYEHELLRRKLEIEVLNSKINPHLLYNSLSAIKLVAFKEKSNEISDMTDILIEYYRLVLNKGYDTITVANELEYLEKYINIHEISKKIKYDVDYDISREALDIKIPHMLLQPIIENSILHGLNTSKDAKIKICVKLDDKRLNISISDNGEGIEQEKLISLNNRTNMGYGLTSVIQRADFYYGGDFDFRIESAKNVGTTVFLSVAKNLKTKM